jgi:LssY-like putative type I secretion system component LssY
MLSVVEGQKARRGLFQLRFVIVKAKAGWTFRTARRRAFIVATLAAFPAALAAGACDQVPAGQTFEIRLLQPLASYSSKPHTSVRALLVESPQCNGSPVFPVGTIVEGHIKSVHRVGMGIRHETAAIQLVFDRFSSADGESSQMQSQVMNVDNARENVRKGVIQGVLGTQTPQGRITSRLKYLPTINPYSDWFLLAFRATFPIFPEPEIYFPAGTDMRLELTAAMQVVNRPPVESMVGDFSPSEKDELSMMVQSLPERTFTRQGQDADAINLVFLGSREQLDDSFAAAGWKDSDPASRRAAFRQFHAFLALKNYPTQPMSQQLFEGRASDIMRQKSLDSYAKRDHSRIWSTGERWAGQLAWVAAGTRDTGAVISFRQKKLIHHVEANIDDERDKIVRDLTVAGCVDAVFVAARPAASRSFANATGDDLRTDGGVGVVKLKDCERPNFESASTGATLQARPRSKFARYFRMQMLSFRGDVLRGNIIHGVFDLSRMSIRAFRSNRARNEAREYARSLRSPAPETSHAPVSLSLTSSTD